MFEVTNRDIKEAQRCLEHDRIMPSPRGVFRGVIFCLLSIGQLYKTQLIIYRNLLYHGLDCPEEIQARSDIAKMIVGSARYPSAMWGYITDLCANWWAHEEFFQENFVFQAPREDNSMELREELVRRVKGFGYKIASLYLCLCGVQNVATVDVWTIRFLINQGYTVDFDYKRKGGLSKTAYLQCEKYMLQEAKKYKVSVAFFQVIVWTKLSSWNKRYDSRQLWLPFEEIYEENLETRCN